MLSQLDSINSNCFIINRSEVDGRLDPLYYNSNLNRFIQKYDAVSLRSVCLSFKSGFGAGKDDQTTEDNGIIQLRPTNMDNEGFLKFDKNVFVPYNPLMEFLKPRTVLFNNTNSQELVGKTALLLEDKELYYSNHITAIRVNEEKISPEYLWLILNIYQQNGIFYTICTNWNNQSGVGIELLKSLKIPLPSMKIQQQIVDIYCSASDEKREKEMMSNKLLNSIDRYLLDELRVELPVVDNSLQNRVFITTFKDVTGSRLDPKLYDANTQNLKAAIERSHLHKTSLKNLVTHSSAGDWGLEETEDFEGEKYERCLVIRATEFDNKYNLNLDNSRVKYRLINRSKLLRMNIRENDLLIEKSGGSPDQPVGRIAILSQDIFKGNSICYSNFIYKIRIDETKAIPMYVFSFLKTLHNVKLTEAMQSQTNGIRNLIMNTYLNQTIVLPNLEKQKEIANNIKLLREQAKKLHIEASAILEIAKKRVEQIILGERL
ncbi:MULTISPECIES: restriction endonuclease subunit S [unclassified Bacteroides]|uniref:restriction endonuclease subunit S n=1 Tax=unclassified Bacteroides TaxID=2646097 RepID=UPI0013EAE9B6|nr:MULTISPECIES: restriction endonuclease subunit S [unclassified Bacteroides]QTO27127.1 restriction endonuclease subunit S [Bacteroides sp. ZJ-18]